MPEVCHGIMLAVTAITKASFLIVNMDARRLSNDAIELRRINI